MKPIFKNLFTLAIGFIVSCAVISLVQYINQLMFPFPEGFDFSNKEDLARLLEVIPVPAMLMVELSYILGSLIGGFTIGTYAQSHHLFYAGVLGGILTLANILNIMSIPHPLWMSGLTMITFIPMALIGCSLAHLEGR